MSRRQFLVAAGAAAAATAIPLELGPLLAPARASGNTTHFFFDRPGPAPVSSATCAALCDRIVPSDTGPGAATVGAVTFIDRFLSAFELPSTLADNPAIYVKGRYSSRNPYPDGTTGQATATYPNDQLLGHFLPLSTVQALSWRAQLYGSADPTVKAQAAKYSSKWVSQLGSLNPGASPSGLRGLYAAGIPAFDAWSKSLFGTPFASASTQQQDAMVTIVGNPVLGAIPLASLFGALPLPIPDPAPPAAAQALFGTLVVHTMQGVYGLPEYVWSAAANPTWDEVDWTGDTEPLGNTVWYFDKKHPYNGGPNPNDGFGDGVYELNGDYREVRPVSTLEPGASTISASQIAPVLVALGKTRRAAK